MTNEELTQKNDALPEKELDDVSGGLLIFASAPGFGAAVVTCPNCNSPLVTNTGGNNYVCNDCHIPFTR